MSVNRLYLVAALLLAAANVAVATAPRAVDTAPWGACFMAPGGGNCSCEEDLVDPDCHGVDQCRREYPEFCPVE
jgi:hypothetical protein